MHLKEKRKKNLLLAVIIQINCFKQQVLFRIRIQEINYSSNQQLPSHSSRFFCLVSKYFLKSMQLQNFRNIGNINMTIPNLSLLQIGSGRTVLPIIISIHLQMQNTTITCPNPNCNSKLKKTGNSYVKCANCGFTFFSFCHQFPSKTLQYVQCKKCPNELYYFFCVKCKGVLCFKNYRMGSISKCKCGFDGCYVVCNNCMNFECYPPNKSYEGVPWCCTKCNQPFNFMTCGNCFHPIYKKYFNAEEKVKCVNQKCNVENKVKVCRDCQEKYLDTRNKIICTRCQKRGKSLDKMKGESNQQSETSSPLTPPPPSYRNKPSFTQNTQQLQKAKLPQPTQNTLPLPQTPTIQKSFGKQIESLCKICLDKTADYINLKCFHMSCCGVCVDSLNNICPLCRAEGKFQKVFR